MSIEENVRVAIKFIDALGASDQATIGDLFADDGYCQTMGNTLVSGYYYKDMIAGSNSRTNEFFKVFPEGIDFTITNTTAQDDRVAVEAISHGKHSSGKIYNNYYHFFLRIRDGKIIVLKEYCDTEHVTDVMCGGAKRDSGENAADLSHRAGMPR